MKKITKGSMALLAGLTLAAPLAINAGLVTSSPVVVSAQEASEPVTLHLGYESGSGRSLTTVLVVMQGDKVQSVFLDELQYSEGDEWEGVPSSDGGFGENYPEGKKLVSKRANDETYSTPMKEDAGAQYTVAEGYDAIQEFAVGKTVDELKAAKDELEALPEDGNISDVISGATLTSADSYLGSIIETIEDGYTVEGESVENGELKTSLQAPHGDKAFAVVGVVLDGDKIAAATIDELQFVEGEDWDSIVDSDTDFGGNYPEGKVLASKLENDEEYSAMMKENADATKTYAENIKAITDFAKGKTVAELEAAIEELNGLSEDASISDVVSGATFVDTAGYLQAIVDTAK